MRDTSDGEEGEPISALESFASWGKVVDLHVKKRKLEELEETEEVENEKEGGDKNGRNRVVKEARIGTSHGSMVRKVESESIKAGIDDDEEEEEEEDEEDEKDEEDMDDDEEDNEDDDNEENDMDIPLKPQASLPMYKAEHITLAPSRPRLIDYSFMGNTDSAIGSRGADGVAMRQPSVVRDLWAQVR